MDIAVYMKYPLFFLLSYSVTILANSVHPELSHSTSKSSPSHYPPTHKKFSNDQLYHAYLVIQRFKKTITCDPKSVTSTWTGHDICGNQRYVGFYCSTPSGQNKSLTITSISFHGFGLCAPKIQGFIDQLPDLAIFDATSNKFTGDIPRLAGLSYMYNLDVGNDHADQRYQPLARHCIVGSIDSIISGSGSGCINYLAAQKTKEISGPAWTNAKALLLNNNNLPGTLPADLGVSKLSYLALANNKLTGPIPRSIGQAEDTLLEILLLNNQLSGCLPNELGMLTKTTVIDAGMNQLTGPIPSSFSCLSSVEQLNLAGNRLYGEVPDALCKLAGPAGRLTNLTLSGNYFTSVGPACSALIKDGVLDVKRNCIPGFASQRGPAECASFLSQPKTCSSASALAACPAADAKKNAAAPEGRVAKGYSSYVTYATLHE